MADVPELIAELGGPAKIARATGIPFTTIDSWKRAEFVPEWRIPALLKVAKKLGKPITAADFPTSRPTPESATARGLAA